MQQLAGQRVRRLLEQHRDRDPSDREATERLLYELGVHQVELEIQNEELQEARTQLELSRDRYERLFHEAPVGYVTTWTDGRIVEANRMAAQMFGVSCEALKRRLLSDFFDPGDRSALRDRETRLLAGEGLQSFELRAVTPSGVSRRVAVQMDVEVNESLDRRLIRTTLLDVDDRVRLEHRLAGLAAIVSSSEDAIIGRDTAGIVTSWNDGARRLFGFEADDMVGRRLDLLVPPGRHVEEHQLLERLARGETVAHLETERLARGEVVVPVSISLSPVRDQYNRIVGSSLIARDISERRHADRALRERLQQLDLLCQAGQSLILSDADVATLRHDLFEKLRIATDCELCLDYVAEPAGEFARLEWMSGFSSDAVTLGESLHLARSAYGAAIRQGASLVVDEVGDLEALPSPLNRAGARCYAVFPIQSRQRTWGLALFATTRRGTFGPSQAQVIQTICDQLAAMLDRRRLIDELQDREQALRTADEAKDAFIATLAHELRNPLAAIRNAVELMKHAGARDERRVTWSRDVIARQVMQLTRLLEDLLDISRLSRNRVELRCEDMDLVRALQQAIESTRPHFEARRQRLVVEMAASPVCLHGDLARLTQVFTNLLHNASKYTDEGGEITLTAQREGAEVRVSIRDNGIGIDAAHLPRVFDMFAQFSGRSGGGLGIGLALTRGLVELHGGRVEARSGGPGQGSEFVVTLPLPDEAYAEPAAPLDEADEAGPDGSCRIVVADDNVDAAQTLATMLAAHGHDVRTAYGGREALELVARWPPDAILLDIGMPDLNGYEVCRRLRTQPALHDVMIIACTGWGQEADRVRSRDAGFDEHLVKPIEPGAVLRLLRSIAGAPAAQRA